MDILKSYQNTTPEANGIGKSIYQNGIIVDLLDIKYCLWQINIDSIAIASSRLIRYVGNSRMSVAQHCVRGAEVFYLSGEIEKAKQFLLHEVAEIIGMGDLPSPIKDLLSEKSTFKEIETQIEKHFFEYWGVKYPFHEDIKTLDKNLAQDEMYMMKFNTQYDYWDSETATKMFISMWDKLRYHSSILDKEIIK